MDTKQLAAALIEAHSALVDKIGKQPYISFNLQMSQSGKWLVTNAYLEPTMRDKIGGPFCDTPEAAIAGVMDVIRKMPNEDERNLRVFHAKISDAIDFGNKHGIDAVWLNPLIETSRALASNAIEGGR